MVLVEREFALGTEVPFMPPHPILCGTAKGPEDLEIMAPHVDAARMAEYRRRLREGMTCIIAQTADERRLQGWVWVANRPYYEAYDNATYQVSRSHMLHVDGEVVSDSRGRGVAFVGFPLIWTLGQSWGFTHCYCAIDLANRASLKLHDRMGYREIGRFCVHELLGFKWTRSDHALVVPGDDTQAKHRRFGSGSGSGGEVFRESADLGGLPSLGVSERPKKQTASG